MESKTATRQFTEIGHDPFGLHALFDYRRAAVRLVGIAPDLARPVLYLSRHSLELALKLALWTAEMEYRHFGAEAQEQWPGHGLAALLNALDFRLEATSNPPLPAPIRRTILRLHDLDPDGQRFRYSRTLRKDGTTQVALPAGMKLDLANLVADVDVAVEHLIELRPATPRTRAQHAKAIVALEANQGDPVIEAPEDFGVPRSTDGSVILPRSRAPEVRPGDSLRVLHHDLETSWTVTGEENGALVLDPMPDSWRIPIALREKRRAAGACPNCGNEYPTAIADPQIEHAVVWDPGVVHVGPPLTHRPDRECPSCHLRFESGPS